VEFAKASIAYIEGKKLPGAISERSQIPNQLLEKILGVAADEMKAGHWGKVQEQMEAYQSLNGPRSELSERIISALKQHKESH